MYITRSPNILTTILCKYIKRKTKYNEGVTRTEDCLVTSHLTMLIGLVVRCSPTQFYICQKTGWGLRYFLSFETENWKRWLLWHYLNVLCELNFFGQQIFNVSPWTRNCPNFTHVKLTNLPLLTSRLYLNFKTYSEEVLHIWRLCHNMLCKKQSVIIIINNKQSNLLLKNWLRFRPFLKNINSGSTPIFENR